LGRTRGIEGLQAAMVGRDAELSALRNVMSDLKQGLGRIVFVLGEAGLGKTRLISEAHQVFQTLGHTQAIWVETISLSYETNRPMDYFSASCATWVESNITMQQWFSVRN
jgi:hypothetical protein